MTKTSSHTEFGKLKSVLLKRPRDGFISNDFIDDQWKSLNYLAPPDFEQSCLDFEYLEDLISHSGTMIHHLPDNQDLSLDSIYCRDASFPTDFGVILCRMGKGARQREPGDSKKFYKSIGQHILGQIEPPGTLEGGDMAWIDEKTLAVGRGYRTNDEGITQLKALLAPFNIDILVAALPHYKGEEDVFHMMSIFSPVDRRKAVVYSPLMPVNFRERLLEMEFQLIETPEEEFESMGTNVLAISPSTCIMMEGNPGTRKRLEEAGCTVYVYDGSEISAKGCGGPTCLTRPILREI